MISEFDATENFRLSTYMKNRLQRAINVSTKYESKSDLIRSVIERELNKILD